MRRYLKIKFYSADILQSHGTQQIWLSSIVLETAFIKGPQNPAESKLSLVDFTFEWKLGDSGPENGEGAGFGE